MTRTFPAWKARVVQLEGRQRKVVGNKDIARIERQWRSLNRRSKSEDWRSRNGLPTDVGFHRKRRSEELELTTPIGFHI